MAGRHQTTTQSLITSRQTLNEKAKKQLEGYETGALVERKRKAVLLSGGKKMDNGHTCANVVSDEDSTMFCRNVGTFGQSKPASVEEIKQIIEGPGKVFRSLSLTPLSGERARKFLEVVQHAHQRRLCPLLGSSLPSSNGRGSRPWPCGSRATEPRLRCPWPAVAALTRRWYQWSWPPGDPRQCGGQHPGQASVGSQGTPVSGISGISGILGIRIRDGGIRLSP